MTRYQRTIDSPIGTLLIETDGKSITKLEAVTRKKYHDKHQLLDHCEEELAEYFAGSRSAFTVPVTTDGTEFQKKVWRAMRRIPHGRTTTYADLAKIIGKPAAVRAVGTACGNNPVLILTPCHRIVGSNGGLGGFSAGLPKKRALLACEAPVSR